MENKKETQHLHNIYMMPVIIFILFFSIITVIMVNYHNDQINNTTSTLENGHNKNVQKYIKVDIDKKIEALKKEHKEYFFQFISISIGTLFVLIIVLLLLLKQTGKLLKRQHQRIQQAEETSLQKNLIISEQSKMARISDLLHMIEHQWKEPLSQINLATLNMYLEQKEGTLDEKNLKNNIVKIENTTQYLFRSIADFSDFFAKQSKEKVFMVNDVINYCVSIISPSLDHVSLHIDLKSKKSLKGYNALFQQIVFTLISNSLDAFNTNSISDPEINIYSYDEKDAVFLEISDNAGEIPNNKLNTIFNLPLLEKMKTQQNGLGLYLVKQIIEQNFRGKVRVTNLNGGLKFMIRIETLDAK